jgi:acetolactate synthase-1/2/3 large subunit
MSIPDPEELNRVYRTDFPICADMREFAEFADSWADEVISFSSGAEAHREWLEWSEPKPRDGVALDLGQVVAELRRILPADTIVCNGAGNFSGWFHRFWHYAGPPSQLAPTNGAMGYGLPAAVAAAVRFPDRQVLCAAGDGDFLMNGQELATAMRHRANCWCWSSTMAVTARSACTRSATIPSASRRLTSQPDFAALARAYGAWAETVERHGDFAPALARAQAERGVKLLHSRPTSSSSPTQHDFEAAVGREQIRPPSFRPAASSRCWFGIRAC